MLVEAATADGVASPKTPTSRTPAGAPRWSAFTQRVLTMLMATPKYSACLLADKMGRLVQSAK
jgi:hypothetical protein